MESLIVNDILADAIKTAVKQDKSIKLLKRVIALQFGVIFALIVSLIFL